MALLPPVFQLLKAAAPVTALLGATPKVYRHGQAPQGTLAPYVVWQLVGADPQNNLSDVPKTDHDALQVDCYHTTDGGVEQLAEAVRNAIEPTAHLTGIVIDEKEPATGLYRLGLQFDWWLSR